MNPRYLVEHFARFAFGAVMSQRQHLERQRREGNPPQLCDGYLFAIALSDLLSAARVAQRRGIGAPELEAAIDAFELQSPGRTDFRNVLEHWDEYDEGKGRNRVRLGIEPGHTWFHWVGVDAFKLRIGGSAGTPLTLDVAKGTNAASALHSVLYRVL